MKVLLAFFLVSTCLVLAKEKEEVASEPKSVKPTALSSSKDASPSTRRKAHKRRNSDYNTDLHLALLSSSQSDLPLVEEEKTQRRPFRSRSRVDSSDGAQVSRRKTQKRQNNEYNPLYNPQPFNQPQDVPRAFDQPLNDARFNPQFNRPFFPQNNAPADPFAAPGLFPPRTPEGRIPSEQEDDQTEDTESSEANPSGSDPVEDNASVETAEINPAANQGNFPGQAAGFFPQPGVLGAARTPETFANPNANPAFFPPRVPEFGSQGNFPGQQFSPVPNPQMPEVRTPDFNGQDQISVMALMPQERTQQPPQITELDATCTKESMIVRLKFDQIFNGVIYSKGFHRNMDCNYVRFNSSTDAYEFVIRLDSCGSQWVDQIRSGGQAYLENVIIVQNEPGIQEKTDTSRTLRCSWESSLEKSVTHALNVDMDVDDLGRQVNAQVVSFSGDTVTAAMDVQVGNGPLAPSASGLVKIGETLTMVVYIEGDIGFDVQVQDCIAHDGNLANAVTLTDKRGCVVKKKLMGPWQKTTTAGAREGVSLVAYSFFKAFKFPDTMDVFFECNIELCKNGCEVCPEDAAVQLGRNRRSITSHFMSNSTDNSDTRLARRVRVVSNEDISLSPDARSAVPLASGNRWMSQEDICLSMPSFLVGLVVIAAVLIISCLITTLLCIKVRSKPNEQSIYPTSPFHAFSSSKNPMS